LVKSLESIESRKTHAFTDGKNLVFSNSDLSRTANFRKFIFGGIEENQRVEGEKIWFSRISPPYLRFGEDRLTDSFKRATRDEPETT